MVDQLAAAGVRLDNDVDGALGTRPGDDSRPVATRTSQSTWSAAGQRPFTDTPCPDQTQRPALRTSRISRAPATKPANLQSRPVRRTTRRHKPSANASDDADRRIRSPCDLATTTAVLRTRIITKSSHGVYPYIDSSRHGLEPRAPIHRKPNQLTTRTWTRRRPHSRLGVVASRGVRTFFRGLHSAGPDHRCVAQAVGRGLGGLVRRCSVLGAITSPAPRPTWRCRSPTMA